MITDPKQMQMEQRDWNYIMNSYMMRYLFMNKNQAPDEVVFPMFEYVVHPRQPGVHIPVLWVPSISAEAAAIAEDGAVVPETSEAVLKEIEERDREIERLKKEVESLQGHQDTYKPSDEEFAQIKKDIMQDGEGEALNNEGLTEEEQQHEAMVADLAPSTPPHSIDPAILAVPVDPEKIKLPEHPATGQSDQTYGRMGNDLIQAKRDMMQEPELDEAEQKPYEKQVVKSEDGDIEVKE